MVDLLSGFLIFGSKRRIFVDLLWIGSVSVIVLIGERDRLAAEINLLYNWGNASHVCGPYLDHQDDFSSPSLLFSCRGHRGREQKSHDDRVTVLSPNTAQRFRVPACHDHPQQCQARAFSGHAAP